MNDVQRLRLVRIAWVICLALSTTTLALFIPYSYKFMLDLQDDGLSRSLSADKIAPHTYATIFTGVPSAIAVVFILIGVLIFWRRSSEWNAAFMSLGLITFGTAYAMFVHPAFASILPSSANLSANGLLVVLNFVVSFLGWSVLVMALFIFPDGRFVPKWSVFLAIFSELPTLLWRLPPDSALSAARWSPILINLFGTVVYGGLVACQIYRYFFISNTEQRQQTKFVLFGLSIGVLLALVASAVQIVSFSSSESAKHSLYILFGQSGLVALPISIAFAILRHRLYDIDIIIRRTLIYSTLTAILGAVFFGGVTVTQSILHSATGQTSDVAVVVSTLAIAALFNPLRRWVQAGIDRRFYRTKYDAQKTLEQFAAVMRDEVDPEKVQAALIGTIYETMQPKSIALWIREPEGTRSDVS